MTVIPAFRGEFGLKLRYHVPYVYALGGGHTVQIEQGEEALYPLAKEWQIIPRAADDSRHGPPRVPGPFMFFKPTPYQPQDVEADIVICPRKRNYGSSKNWPHWEWLADLPGVFAAGAPDSSYDLDCPHAWSYDRFLDASITAMLKAKLVVSTANGLSLLALLCGIPLVVISYRGLVAPGPVLNSQGKQMQPGYWPVPLDELYVPMNHQNVPVLVVDGWEKPDFVRTTILQLREDLC